MSESTWSLELDHVTKRFGGRAALDDVSIKIPAGCAVGLVGPNGAGKTTALKVAMRLLPFEQGAVRLFGSDVRHHHVALKQRVGYVPEQCTVHRWMRVGEVKQLCSRFYAAWNHTLATDLGRRFGLDDDRKVGHLSKGMKAKLLLMLAVAHEPELMLLDEPMVGLDPVAREEFLDGVMQVLTDRQQTIVFSSHMLGDVQRVAERIIMLDEGHVVMDRAVDELLRSTKRIRAVLRDGATPRHIPSGALFQRVQDREWLLTVGDFSQDTVDELRSPNDVDHIEIFDIGLEDILKDVVRGRRMSA